MDGQVTCAGCGTLFLAQIGSCPACGMPAEGAQTALATPIPELPLARLGARRVSTAGRAVLLAVNLALLVVFIALTASEFVVPPPVRRSPTAPRSIATATALATSPVEATVPPGTGNATPAPTPTHAGRPSGGGAAPTATPQPTARATPTPAPATPTATLVLPTPTATTNPNGG